MTLKVENIKVAYGMIEALHGISFAVADKSVVGLIGSNGAGKTTALKAISGLLPLSGGRITLDGRDINGLAPEAIVKLGIVHVPEGRRIFPRMTVRENLDLGAFTRHRDATVERDLGWVYELFPVLKEREEQLAGTLSGGQQQMLAMGRALMSKPRLLMLDEPSMGLSPIMQDKIFDLAREINASGTTLLLVEQNARAALELATHAYVLDTGAIALDGKGSELAHDERVRKAYLGEE
jgi:branched-chain amino acid transport system ATP-binding protein